MSTKALSSIVPGGSAAGSALGYRLMTLSGVPGPDAGFALGDRRPRLGGRAQPACSGSALVVSIPIRGVNAGVRHRAVAGVHRDGLFAAMLVVRAARGPGPCRAIAALDRPQAAAQRGPRGGGRPPHRRSARGARSRPAAARPGRSAGRPRTGCSTPRRCGCSCAPSARRPTSTRCSWRSAWSTSLAVIPITPGGLGIIDVALPSDARRLRPDARHGAARRGHVAAGAVLLPDRARRGDVRHAARRAVEHPASRAAAAAARHRRGRGGEPRERLDFAVRFELRGTGRSRRSIGSDRRADDRRELVAPDDRRARRRRPPLAAESAPIERSQTADGRPS